MFGEGERDILVTFGWVGSFSAPGRYPPMRAGLSGSGRLGRVILWDKRGTGLSERLPPDRLPTLEERMDDMRVVLDAAESERAVALGLSEGGVAERAVRRQPPRAGDAPLIVCGGFARSLYDEDYEWAPTRELADGFNARVGDELGRQRLAAEALGADDRATTPSPRSSGTARCVPAATPTTAIAWLTHRPGHRHPRTCCPRSASRRS